MKWTIQNKVNTGLLMVLTFLIGLGTFSLRTYDEEIKTQKDVIHNYAVIDDTESISSMLKVNKNNILKNTDQLSSLFQEDRDQTDRLKQIQRILPTIFSDFDRIFSPQGKPPLTPDQLRSLSREFQTDLATVQNLLDQMKTREQNRLDERNLILDREVSNMKTLSILFVLSGIVSIALISIALQLDVKRREKVESELRQLKGELETQVRERTSELTQTNEALVDERSFIQSLIENLGEGIAAYDLHGENVYYNPTFEALFGRSIDPLGHGSDSEEPRWYQPDGVTPLAKEKSAFYRALKGEIVRDEEVVLASEAETKQTVLMSGHPLVDQDGKRLGAVVAVHDITERKNIEDQVQRQLSRISSLRQIDLAITSSFDLGFTLSVALDQVLSQLQVSAADVCLLNPKTLVLTYAAGKNFKTDEIRRTRILIKEGLAGAAAYDRQLITIEDLNTVQESPERARLIQREGFAGYCVVPLIAKGQIKGVLEVFHRSPLRPEDEWINFLETLAGQIAIAVDNSELFERQQRDNIELQLAYDKALEGWVKALDLRDHETEGHTQRVTNLTVQLGEHLGIKGEDLVHLRKGALLHDIGKIGIPDHILLKPGPLTEEERVVIEKHPQYAYDLLSPIEFLRPSLDIPLFHHEKWDGTGYPRRLKGEEIPLAARIFAVVDVYDALVSNRPYRKGWPQNRVLEHLQSLSGHHFDPCIVHAFLEVLCAANNSCID